MSRDKPEIILDPVLFPHPEQRADWARERFAGSCYFYPMRDCPGCVLHCGRTPWAEILPWDKPKPREDAP